MAEVIKCNSCGEKAVTITCGGNDPRGICTNCGGTTFHFEEVTKDDV